LWATLLFVIPAIATRITAADAFLAFSILPAPRENVLAVEWTLRHEVLFYLIFGLFLWRPMWGTPLLALWFMSSLLSVFLPSSFPIAFIISPLHILFALGMLGAVAIRHEMHFPKVMSTLGALIFSLTWVAQVENIQLPGVAWPLIYGTGATLLIVGLARLEKMKEFSPPRILKMLGDSSYALYLVHFPIVSLCAKLATALIKTPSSALLILSFLATILLAVVSGLIFHVLIERPAMRLRFSNVL
jgi:peptidoglycan/LPS O-acetylase OafA/YrhL